MEEWAVLNGANAKIILDIWKCVMLCSLGILGIFLETEETVVGYEVITAVVMKSTTLWDITTCSPMTFNGRFRGTYRFRLHGRRIIPVRY
jgi:hypothetical protein